MNPSLNIITASDATFRAEDGSDPRFYIFATLVSGVVRFEVVDAGSWLDSLTSSDDKQRLREVQSVQLPDLSACWSRLTPDEQHYIQRSLATANGLYETVKILSRLVECLQRRLDEAEPK